jgi:hypothetical protein
MDTSFVHCNHLPAPGLCKVFELGMDRASEVEVLCAPPGKDRGGPAGAGSVVEKLRAAWVR